MKLILKFGINEPDRQINWWTKIIDFPPLVLYKNKKWEFVVYHSDPTNKVDYICVFSEIKSYDPNWDATTYEDMDRYIDDGLGKCECGSAYTSFSNGHMTFCPKWTKFK